MLACAVCVGNPDHAVTAGMNMAIGFLLLVVGGVCAGFLAFIGYLARKAKEAQVKEREGAFGYLD